MQHQPTKLLKAVPASVSTSLQLLCATVAVALLVPAPSVSTSLQLSKAAPASVSNSLQLSKAAMRKPRNLSPFWVRILLLFWVYLQVMYGFDHLC